MSHVEPRAPLPSPGSNLPRHPRIDVSHLPESLEDHRSPIWVGNLVLVLIETVVFGLLVASYFYIRRNFELWPPPLSNALPANLNPLPSLGVTTANLIVLLISLAPWIYADRSALHLRRRATTIGLLLSMLCIIVAIALRFFEFKALHFRWSDNAYAAITWTILGMHLLHLCIALGESIIMTTWIILKGIDKKHGRDVRVTAVYWYWVVGTWIPLYFILYWGPRL